MNGFQYRAFLSETTMLLTSAVGHQITLTKKTLICERNKLSTDISDDQIQTLESGLIYCHSLGLTSKQGQWAAGFAWNLQQCRFRPGLFANANKVFSNQVLRPFFIKQNRRFWLVELFRAHFCNLYIANLSSIQFRLIKEAKIISDIQFCFIKLYNM